MLRGPETPTRRYWRSVDNRWTSEGDRRLCCFSPSTPNALNLLPLPTPRTLLLTSNRRRSVHPQLCLIFTFVPHQLC